MHGLMDDVFSRGGSEFSIVLLFLMCVRSMCSIYLGI